MEKRESQSPYLGRWPETRFGADSCVKFARLLSRIMYRQLYRRKSERIGERYRLICTSADLREATSPKDEVESGCLSC